MGHGVLCCSGTARLSHKPRRSLLLCTAPMSSLHGRSLSAPGASAVCVQVTEAAALSHWDIANWMLWTSHAPSFPWRFDDFVAFNVLAGNATIAATDAWLLHRVLVVKPGDMVLLPKGFAATWNAFPAITFRWVHGEFPPLAFGPYTMAGPTVASQAPSADSGITGSADPAGSTAAPSGNEPGVGSAVPGSKDGAPPPGGLPSDATAVPLGPGPAYVNLWDLPFPLLCQPPPAPTPGAVPTEPQADSVARPPPPGPPSVPVSALFEATPPGPAAATLFRFIPGWIPLADSRGGAYWWDTVLNRTTWQYPTVPAGAKLPSARFSSS